MAAIYEPKGMAREYAPLACNLYTGCLHGCLYCYAPDCVRQTPQAFHASSEPRKDILAQLEKDAATLGSTDGGLFDEPKAKDERRVLFCFTSDPYQPNEAEHGTTRRALEIMHRAGLNFQVLTKGGIRAIRDFDIMQAAGAHFGTSLCFNDDTVRAKWEPNAASVSRRLAAVAQAHDLGIRTWVSIEPVIDPAQALALIDVHSDIVDEWRVGKLNHHAHAASIDWSAFAGALTEALEASPSDYMIKDALHKFLPQGAPTRRYAAGIPGREEHRVAG